MKTKLFEFIAKEINRNYFLIKSINFIIIGYLVIKKTIQIRKLTEK